MNSFDLPMKNHEIIGFNLPKKHKLYRFQNQISTYIAMNDSQSMHIIEYSQHFNGIIKLITQRNISIST